MRLHVAALTTLVLGACSYDATFTDCSITCSVDTGCPESFTCGPEALCRPLNFTTTCCSDLGNQTSELLSDGVMGCGVLLRYMIDPGSASTTERCTELGFDRYDDQIDFTAAEWCTYCNARTKEWDGTQWVANGCNVGVNTLRCCHTH